jgi:signal transduction histidine kinase
VIAPAMLASAAVLVCLACYAAATVSLGLRFASSPLAVIWLPNGLLLAVLLLVPIYLMIVAIPVILLAATIVERDKAEEALRLSEERYREVVERQTERDISDRERAEETHRTLVHAQRLAVVGELTASIAHEINQPLNAMFNNAEAAEMLLEMERPRLEEVRQILADIRRQDLMASQVVHRMRTLLARHELEISGLDLNETIADALRLIAADALRRRIVLDSELARPLPPVRGDRVHLQQVLLNLAVNGMDAMAGVPDARRRLIVRTAHTGDGFVDVAVSDSGHGIGADRQARLFESFFTTKKDGMGLGLSIARSIVQAHHGRIWAENNAAGGATFHFALPASRASECSISTTARP